MEQRRVVGAPGSQSWSSRSSSTKSSAPAHDGIGSSAIPLSSEAKCGSRASIPTGLREGSEICSELLASLVALNCGAQAKPRHHGIDGGSGMVPGPWLRLGLAGKRMVPGSLTERLGEARLRLMVEALLARQQGERRDQGDGQSNLPTGRWAHAEEMEEELHRPPFRHQILLPIRRGEVVSRQWQRHHACVATQRLARSTVNRVGPPSRVASRPGRPT